MAEPRTRGDTIASMLQAGTQMLVGTSPTPRLDAEVLLMHVSNLPRAALITRSAYPAPTAARGFWRLLERRRGGEPLAYLTGRREFWSLALRVSRDTLVPRPETEILVERALACIPADGAWDLADIGTGCGAIALALARERPRCRVIATDICPRALAVACANAEALACSRIEFRRGRWLAPLAGERLDLIVSNPPYVRAGDPQLRRGNLRFEPRLALVGGADGLEALNRLIAEGKHYLRAGGWLLLEHAPQQTRAIAQSLRDQGYVEIECSLDLAGLERVSAARRPLGSAPARVAKRDRSTIFKV